MAKPRLKLRTIASTVAKEETAAPAQTRDPTAPTIRTNGRANGETSTSPEAPASPAMLRTTATGTTPDLLRTIKDLGMFLDGLEELRIQNGNRIGATEREHGTAHPALENTQKMLKDIEHQVELELVRVWRKHPLAPWAKQIPGLGEKLIARLIAEIGDPGARENPAKLWAYCGHGDPARAGQIPAGISQEELFKRGNPAAKKATRKIAYQFMRTVGSNGASVHAEAIGDAPQDEASRTTQPTARSPRSPYRDVYEQARERYKERVHEKPCKRCGPSGKPAAAGSDWSDAHKHAAALRFVGKRFLLDLWKASRAA